jgi:hypothetical protein
MMDHDGPLFSFLIRNWPTAPSVNSVPTLYSISRKVFPSVLCLVHEHSFTRPETQMIDGQKLVPGTLLLREGLAWDLKQMGNKVKNALTFPLQLLHSCGTKTQFHSGRITP